MRALVQDRTARRATLAAFVWNAGLAATIIGCATQATAHDWATGTLLTVLSTLYWVGSIVLVPMFAARAVTTTNKARERLDREAEKQQRLDAKKFRRVYTTADGDTIRVWVDGGDIDYARNVGSYSLDDEDEMLSKLESERAAAREHRERVERAERLSAEVNGR